MTIPLEKPANFTGIDIIVFTDGEGRYLQFPKLTTAQRDALSAVNGMMIYNTTTSRLEAYQNGSWGPLGGAGSFIDLTDTPSDYVGRGGDVVLVKTTEDGIATQPWPVVGTTINYFLTNNAADIGSYYYLYPTETGEAYSELTSSSLSAGDDQLLWSFVTEAGEPGMDVLALGAYTTALFLEKTGNKDVRVYWKLFKRNTGGTETEILQSAASDYLTASTSQYVLSGYLNEDQTLDTTDRLVLKLYANVSGTGTDVTVKLTMEGDYDSRLTINILSSAFNLDRLSDVTITSPADDEALAYDSGSGKWVNQALTDSAAIHDNVAGEIAAIAEKTSPVANDKFLIDDSDDSNNPKSVKLGNLGSAGIVMKTLNAATIYVDYTAGNDTTGDGSSGNPYKTIQKAIDELPDLSASDVEIAVSGGPHILSSPISFIGKQVTGTLTLKAKDTSGNDLYDSGTATGGSSTTLEDTSKSWPTDFWNGGRVYIWQGTGVGEIRDITGNTSNTLTISSGTAPDSTSQYVIVKIVLDGNATATNIFNNFADNIRIEGFILQNSTGDLLRMDPPATGRAGIEIYRNALLSPGQDGINTALVYSADIEYNYFSVGSARYGLVCGYGGFYIKPRSNVFIAQSAGSGTGLYAYGPTIAAMIGGLGANTFIDLSIGEKASAGAILYNGSAQTFINCTTNYTPSAASDPAYIS